MDNGWTTDGKKGKDWRRLAKTGEVLLGLFPELFCSSVMTVSEMLGNLERGILDEGGHWRS